MPIKTQQYQKKKNILKYVNSLPLFRSLIIGIFALSSYTSLANYNDDIGRNRLNNELGENAPQGSGVNVTVVELGMAPAVNPKLSLFEGKTITNIFANEIPGFGDSNNRIFFDLNSEIGTVWLDDIKVCLNVCSDSDDNILTNNSTFDNTLTDWVATSDVISVVTEDDNHIVESIIENPNLDEAWSVSLGQILSLQPLESYIVSFRAKASQARSISVGLGLNYDPWTNVAEPVQLTEDWQTFTLTQTTIAYANHATEVSRTFFGNRGSMAPGITDITLRDGFTWFDDFLEAPLLEIKRLVGPQPNSSSSRVATHSYGYAKSNEIINPIAADMFSGALRRIDWLIHKDEFMQVAALQNGPGFGSTIMYDSAYNMLSVGRTDGQHISGTLNIDSIYKAGRTRPHIVAPREVTSNATPLVSGAVAVLVEVGHNSPELSTDPDSDSTINRNGNIIYNAERSEVIKAALMAGAERETNNTTEDNIHDYRLSKTHQSNNGLDTRFGAGQLNIYNSYQIITAGEQNNIESNQSNAGVILNNGFDYVPSFGGANNSIEQATYFYSTEENTMQLTTSLAWNLAVEGGNIDLFDGAATFHNLDLFLYDITNATSQDDWVLVASSESDLNNSENIFALLNSHRDFALQVLPANNQQAFDWDYALAWQILPFELAEPTNLSAEQGTELAVNLSWQDNSDNETGFVIQRREANGQFVEVTTLDANTTQFIDTVDLAVTYEYKVLAAYNSLFITPETTVEIDVIGSTQADVTPNPSITSDSGGGIHWGFMLYLLGCALFRINYKS